MNSEQDHDRDQTHATEVKPADTSVPGRRSASAALDGPETPVPSGIVSRKARGTEAGLEAAPLQFKVAEELANPAPAAASKEVATRGIEGAGSALPHLDQIQQSFGHHDVRGVQAHVGGAAATANQQLGSEAFAMGNRVAFDGAPSLHTAAHEAAHTVQQRAGAQVTGGVGAANDEHEKHADKVADAVVAGTSAEGLLDAVAGGDDALTEMLQFKRPAPLPLESGIIDATATEVLVGQTLGHNDWRKQVDWKGLSGWLGGIDNTQKQLTSQVNPLLDSALTAVETTRDMYKLQLDAAFQKEQAKIQEMVKTDPAVRTSIEEIRTTGASIAAQFVLKSGALDAVDAAANDMVAATANKQGIETAKDSDKASGNLAEVEKQKAAALAELMAIPEMIRGAVDLGKEVAAKGPAAVAISKGTDVAKGLADQLVMAAYKGWADKVVADKYDVTIKNLQFKIRGLQAQIPKLKDKEAAAQLARAVAAAKAAAKNVQAADMQIANLSKHVAATRKTLMITVGQRHKDIAVFSLTHEATEAMSAPLADYRMALGESRKAMNYYAPWQQYYGQLTSISYGAQGLGYLEGGKLPQLGEQQKQTPAEEAKMQRTVARTQEFTGWLGRLGNYVVAEQAFVDVETQKVTSGAYVDFIQEIEAKIIGML